MRPGPNSRLSWQMGLTSATISSPAPQDAGMVRHGQDLMVIQMGWARVLKPNFSKKIRDTGLTSLKIRMALRYRKDLNNSKTYYFERSDKMFSLNFLQYVQILWNIFKYSAIFSNSLLFFK